VLPRSFERVEAVMREYGGMLLILIMFTGARLLSPVIISTYRFLLDLMGLTG